MRGSPVAVLSSSDSSRSVVGDFDILSMRPLPLAPPPSVEWNGDISSSLLSSSSLELAVLIGLVGDSRKEKLIF